MSGFQRECRPSTLPLRLRTDAFPPGVRRVASAEAAHSGGRKGRRQPEHRTPSKECAPSQVSAEERRSPVKTLWAGLRGRNTEGNRAQGREGAP